MKRFLILIAIVAICSSCATIFTRSSYPITFTSEPEKANLTIENRAGRTIYTGTTPTTVELKSAAGYMKREEYSITFERDGYEPHLITLVADLDGWYMGNIFIGGLIGMLIVDPASGAMFKFQDYDRYIHIVLNQSEKEEHSERGLKIIDIDQVPEGAKLVRVN